MDRPRQNALAGPAETVVKEAGREIKGTYSNQAAAELTAPKTSIPKSKTAGPQQQKLDQGIDDLWGAIQLTGKEAKVL